MLFTLIGGLIGQLFKSDPNVKNWIPQAIMIVLGVLVYALNNGLPAPTPVAVVDWLELALVAAAALPGAASLFSLIPDLQTRQN